MKVSQIKEVSATLPTGFNDLPGIAMLNIFGIIVFALLT
jgi:hypothetical protein